MSGEASGDRDRDEVDVRKVFAHQVIRVAEIGVGLAGLGTREVDRADDGVEERPEDRERVRIGREDSDSRIEVVNAGLKP